MACRHSFPAVSPWLAPQARSTADKDDKYRIWLEKLRALCTDVNVPLLFDEVYTGFRMAVGGAQQYYGIQVYFWVASGGLASIKQAGLVWAQLLWMSALDGQ